MISSNRVIQQQLTNWFAKFYSLEGAINFKETHYQLPLNVKILTHIKMSFWQLFKYFTQPIQVWYQTTQHDKLYTIQL